MESFNNLLERLKEHYKVSKKWDLCERIGANRNTFNTWINRKAIPLDKLYDIAEREKLSLNWVVFGIGEKYLNKIHIQNEKLNINENSDENMTINLDNSCINREEIKDILKLLEFAPKPYLNKVKLQLEKMKKLVEEN